MIEFFFIHVLPVLFCLLAMGWYPCCGGVDCPHCSGVTPQELEVTISGLANVDCTDCEADMEDTFTLISVGQIAGQCCYDYEGGDWCLWDRLRCCLIPGGGEFFLEVSFQDSTGTAGTNILWHEDLGAYAPDCDAWSNFSVTVTDQPQTECEEEFASCTVTAL